MHEISHSIFYEHEEFLARVPRAAEFSFLNRRGLESLIFEKRARAQDTESLEHQHAMLVRAETLLLEDNPSTNRP